MSSRTEEKEEGWVGQLGKKKLRKKITKLAAVVFFACVYGGKGRKWISIYEQVPVIKKKKTNKNVFFKKFFYS